MPDEVTDALAGPAAAAAGLIDAAAAAAERAFTALCRGYSPATVGCWFGRPVEYPLFGEFRPPVLTPALVRQLGWAEAVGGGAGGGLGVLTDRLNRQLADAAPRGDVYQRLVAGWAARISFHPDYRAELAEVRAGWEALTGRPRLPVHIGELAQALHDGSTRADDADTTDGRLPDRFAGRYYRFLLKWQLAHHVTWDLPVPLAPQEGVPLGVAVRMFGPDWVVPVVPAYAAFPQRADRPRVERALRQANAAAVGLPPDAVAADLAGHEGKDHAPARRLRAYLVELAVRSRYGNRRGLIDRLLTGPATSGCRGIGRSSTATRSPPSSRADPAADGDGADPAGRTPAGCRLVRTHPSAAPPRTGSPAR